MSPEPDDVVAWWRGAKADWFSKDPGFDRRFRERFLDLHLAAAAGELQRWTDTPEGTLALLILLDQFPRNAFRGTARMYATDPPALGIARRAVEAGHMARVPVELRLFFCLPFAHSENEADQAISVALHARLGQPLLSHAERHCDIVRRFGRFPHRNPLLGRTTTPDEQAFLDQGGFAG